MRKETQNQYYRRRTGHNVHNTHYYVYGYYGFSKIWREKYEKNLTGYFIMPKIKSKQTGQQQPFRRKCTNVVYTLSCPFS